jgi:hypothetical protein
MVNEVENILNEIRERVRNEHAPANAPLKIVPAEELAPGSLIQTNSKNGSGKGESLNRLSAYLTATARAWDRLPPLYSNRKGWAARFELWIKARLKSVTRWFTWEQINFNSAVHHALSETLHALSAAQQELAATRAELRTEAEASRERFERNDLALAADIEALTAEIRKRIANLEAHKTALETHSSAIETRIADVAAATAHEADYVRAEIASRLAELAAELRESDQQLREEQRVCFKQLSLEANETAVSEDRGRRSIESRLDELEKDVSNGKG